jgi:phosphatidylglycerophosphatase C
MSETQPVSTCAASEPTTGSVSPDRVAVFDLDGTLTRIDTFLPFLATYAWRRRKPWRAAVIPLVVLAYLSRLVSDRTAKQFLLRCFLFGEKRDDVEAHARDFCNWIKPRLHPLGLTKLREHVDGGDRVIVVSASPDVYVPEIARSLGVEEVVCTKVRWNDELCLGMIDGENCKREAKITMLSAYLGAGANPQTMTAYGDSRSDLPLLCWVKNGFLISRSTCTQVSSDVNT